MGIMEISISVNFKHTVIHYIYYAIFGKSILFTDVCTVQATVLGT